MRKLLFATVAVMGLAASTTVFAQSQQGGYLGLNPGAQQTASTIEAPRAGSQEGGYLGLNAGAKLTTLRPAAPSLADELADPVAWCATSTDPGHCRANAEADQQICVANPQHYDACRYAMSQMFNKNR
jgi:hypothetical protein